MFGYNSTLNLVFFEQKTQRTFELSACCHLWLFG